MRIVTALSLLCLTIPLARAAWVVSPIPTLGILDVELGDTITVKLPSGDQDYLWLVDWVYNYTENRLICGPFHYCRRGNVNMTNETVTFSSVDNDTYGYYVLLHDVAEVREKVAEESKKSNYSFILAPAYKPIEEEDEPRHDMLRWPGSGRVRWPGSGHTHWPGLRKNHEGSADYVSSAATDTLAAVGLGSLFLVLTVTATAIYYARKADYGH